MTMLQEITEKLRAGGYCYAGAEHAAASAVVDVARAEVERIEANLKVEYERNFGLRAAPPAPTAPSLQSPTWPPLPKDAPSSMTPQVSPQPPKPSPSQPEPTRR